MAPLSTIHLQTILGFLNQALMILVKNVGSTAVELWSGVRTSMLYEPKGTSPNYFGKGNVIKMLWGGVVLDFL